MRDKYFILIYVYSKQEYFPKNIIKNITFFKLEYIFSTILHFLCSYFRLNYIFYFTLTTSISAQFIFQVKHTFLNIGLVLVWNWRFLTNCSRFANILQKVITNSNICRVNLFLSWIILIDSTLQIKFLCYTFMKASARVYCGISIIHPLIVYTLNTE